MVGLLSNAANKMIPNHFQRLAVFNVAKTSAIMTKAVDKMTPFLLELGKGVQYWCSIFKRISTTWRMVRFAAKPM